MKAFNYKSLLYLTVLLFATPLFITSCGGDEPEEIIEDTTVVIQDNMNEEVTAADTSSTGVYQEETEEGPGSLEEALQSSNEEVVEEGGLSFCDCVKKQKELETIMLETEDDAEFDRVMEELENMKTGDCKILFAGNITTIEEKRAHERKVKKCLGK